MAIGPIAPAQVIPPHVLGFSRADVSAQRALWFPTTFWRTAFAGYPALFDDLVTEVAVHGGIRRTFVHERALAAPAELFLAAMAWGFGAQAPRFPVQRNMLVGNNAAVQAYAASLAAIVQQTQTHGAGAGWRALLVTNRVPGLDMSFGTKLVYFAGYTVNNPGPRPLVLDQHVRAALNTFAPNTVPATGTVRQAHYLAYLDLAASWAQDQRWNESPEVVEFALFSYR